MTETLKRSIDLFTTNCLIMKSPFFYTDSSMLRICAYSAICDGKSLEPDKLFKCKELLETVDDDLKTIMSQLFPFLSAKLSVSDDKEQALSNIIRSYRAIREKFAASPYLVYAACILADGCANSCDYNDAAASVRSVYDELDKLHPLATGFDDVAACAAYAMAEKSKESVGSNIEKCMTILQNASIKKNNAQSIALTVSLLNDPEAVSLKAIDIMNELSERKVSLGTKWHLSIVGTLVALNENAKVIAERVAEVDGELKKKSGFSFWSISAKERRMYAAMLVSLDAIKNRSSIIQSQTAVQKIAIATILAANTYDNLSGIINYKV